MPYAKVSTGIEIYFERIGTGHPIILIMGTGLDHSCWDNQIAEYMKYFECIYFDNRSTGKTRAPEGPLSSKLMAEDTAALMDSIGIQNAHVSGLSLGSTIAQELTIMRPDLVKTLQLHGTWAKAYGYAERKFKSQIRLLKELDLREFYEINSLWFMTPGYMNSYPEKVSSQIESIIKSAPSRHMLIEQYKADLNHDALDRLGKINVPTLVTVGSFDLAAPPMYAEEVAGAISNSKLVMFPEGGHFHNVENPEEFNKVTLDFLDRNT